MRRHRIYVEMEYGDLGEIEFISRRQNLIKTKENAKIEIAIACIGRTTY